MAVSMVKDGGRHAACDTWQTFGPPCVGHGPWCDRVVMVDVTTHDERDHGMRVVGFTGEDMRAAMPLAIVTTGAARHAA